MQGTLHDSVYEDCITIEGAYEYLRFVIRRIAGITVIIFSSLLRKDILLQSDCASISRGIGKRRWLVLSVELRLDIRLFC